MKVYKAQAINHHLKLLSVQVMNDLLHDFVLSHENKSIVQRYFRFFEIGNCHLFLQSDLCYQLFNNLILHVPSLSFPG